MDSAFLGREPVSGDALLSVLEGVTAEHERLLRGAGVPVEKLAAFHLRAAARIVAEIADPEVRRFVAGRVANGFEAHVAAVEGTR